jgi:8-oxo-dGTP diphosphatase
MYLTAQRHERALPTSGGMMTRMPTLTERQRVAAYGVARRGDEVLLVRASSATGVPGTWWLPGGGLRFGESPAECLAREFMEETGLVAQARDLLDVISDVAVWQGESMRLHSVRLIYEVEVRLGPVRPETDGSTDAVRWARYVDLAGLPLIPWLRALDVTQLTPP